MKTVSNEFKRDIYKASRSIDIRVTVGSIVYGTSAVKSFSIESSIQSSEGYSIGETIASTLDLEMITSNFIFQTDPIKVEVALLVTKVIEGVETQVWEWVTLGKFYVEELKTTGGGKNRSIKASDGMIKTEEYLVGQYTEATTLSALASLVTSTSGFTWLDTIPATTITPLTELPTVRETIGYIASCMGGNAVITPNGQSIKIVYPGTQSRASIGGSNYFSFYADDYSSVIGRIDCEVNRDTTLTASSGTGTTILEIKNPIMTQALLNNVVTIVDDVNIRGFELDAQGDFSLEPGDLITVSDIYSGTWGLTITGTSFSYSGGISMGLSAKGVSQNINVYGQQGGTLSKEIDSLKENAVGLDTTVEYDPTMTQTSFSSEGTTVGDSLTSLNTLIVNTMTTGYVGTVDLQAYLVQAEKAFITDALITSLSASKINAGTINANVVTIQSGDGKMTFAGNVLQVKDTNDTTRVQVGKDANNNYGVYVCDANGNLIFDSTNGLKAEGIKSPIIVDQMISDDASIDGAKIDIQSLITEVNANGQTETIKASKIYLDTQEQTLQVGFSEMSDHITNDIDVKLTPEGLTTTISNAVSDGANGITGKNGTTVKFIMDTNGLTIKNGGIKIRNHADTQDMFYVDTDGNLTMAGILKATSISTNSGKFSVSSSGIMSCTDAIIQSTSAEIMLTMNDAAITYWVAPTAGASPTDKTMEIARYGINFYTNNTTQLTGRNLASMSARQITVGSGSSATEYPGLAVLTEKDKGFALGFVDGSTTQLGFVMGPYGAMKFQNSSALTFKQHYGLGSSSIEMEVVGSKTTGDNVSFQATSGSYAYVLVNNVSLTILYQDSSDRRLKKSIECIKDEIVAAVDETDFVQFRFEKDSMSNNLRFGIIAQDLIGNLEKRGIDPMDTEIIHKIKMFPDDEEEYYKIKYEDLLVIKLESCNRRIKALEEKIQELENR